MHKQLEAIVLSSSEATNDGPFWAQVLGAISVGGFYRVGPGRLAKSRKDKNDSMTVATFFTTLAIFSQKHLGQAPQGDGADQSYQPEQVPAVPTETQDAETVRQSGEGHEQEEGAGEVTVHAPTAERVHHTRRAHGAERDRPDGCSPTAADSRSPGHDNGNGRKPIQEENTPSA